MAFDMVARRVESPQEAGKEGKRGEEREKGDNLKLLGLLGRATNG